MDTARDSFHRLIKSSSDVIHLGPGGARVVRVSSERVEYIDSPGEEQVIDLAACAKNWARLTSHQRCFPAPTHVLERFYAENRCIGRRGASWVQFMDRSPQTLFEFSSEDEWRGFSRAIDEAGWDTFDTDAAGEKEGKEIS
jgi:hypothetical protein